ncbi:MAG: hypothetical protein IPM54_01850 [Polyangiaceae bacterium]|nr:hypothetical protein [Polyangiaceae bacterium]
MWRQEDDALLARLTDEVAFERLVQAQMGSDASVPWHASGLCAAIRSTPGGVEVLDAARMGNVTPLVERLDPAQHLNGSPELLHHLALHHARLAEALGEADAHVRSIIAWLALTRQERYLRELGEAVVGGALPREELERTLAEVPMWPIDEIGERAKSGARDLTTIAKQALVVLRRVPEACHMAGVSNELEARVTQRANSHMAAAIEDAITPILTAIAETTARGEPTAREGAALMQRFAAVWHWSGEDENVEHAAVDECTPLAWNHCRQSRWGDLGILIEPIWPLIDSLTRRIETDPSKIAYAGRCAQMLVFKADVARTEVETTAIAERALRICPSHRNARLTLAHSLCEQALRLLPGARAPTHHGCTTAEAMIKRAESLYSASSRLPEAQKRLAEAKKLLGIAS